MAESKPLIVDLSSVHTADEFHTILAEALGFPVYYGQNWDAFWDIIRNPGGHCVVLPRKVYFTGWDVLSHRLPREACLFTICVQDLLEHNVGLCWRRRTVLDELASI